MTKNFSPAGKSFTAQVWGRDGDELPLVNVYELSYDAAKHVALDCRLPGQIGRVICEDEDFRVVEDDHGRCYGTLAQTMRMAHVLRRASLREQQAVKPGASPDLLMVVFLVLVGVGLGVFWSETLEFIRPLWWR